MIDVWFAALFFVFVMGAVIAGGYVLILRREPATGAPDVLPELAPGDGIARRPLLARTFAAIGERVPAARRTESPVRNQLIAAGYFQPSALAAFYGVKCASAVAGAAAFAAITTWSGADATSIPLLAGGGLGYLLPGQFLGRAAHERRKRLRRALPTALDLCSLSLEAGQPLDQAVLDTSRGLRRSYPDLATELQMFHIETRTSNDRAEALRNLARRTGEPEVRKVALLLADAERFGTSIAPSLRNHARYLRIRMRQNAQEAARKVGVKLVFPVFFLIFPSVILVTLAPALILVTQQLRSMLER